MNKEYLKPKEVAKILRVHPVTIYRMIKSNAIKVSILPTPTNQKKRYRIHRDEVNKLLNKTPYDGNRNPQNQEDSRSGGNPISAVGSSGGNTPGLESTPQQDNVPIQE